MPFKDALVFLPTHPEPVTDKVVEEAALVAAGVAGSATLVAPVVHFKRAAHPYADLLFHTAELARTLETQSASAAAGIAAQFETAARGLGVYGGYYPTKVETFEIPDLVARLARTRDLCIVPCRPDGLDRVTAEAVIFGSGRPVLLYPQGHVSGPYRPRNILVAWDGGRAAARAVADALPLLTEAKTELVTVKGEKPSAQPEAIEALARHLARHGVDAGITEIEHGKAFTEQAIIQHARKTGADLVVMGAFGRSSLREFILGGVTDSMLQAPPFPVLLAH